MKVSSFSFLKKNKTNQYSAADFNNESIPMEEGNTAFISGFEARNTQNALHPYIHETPSLIIIGVLLVNS